MTNPRPRLIQRVCPLCRKPHTPAITCAAFKRVMKAGAVLQGGKW